MRRSYNVSNDGGGNDDMSLVFNVDFKSGSTTDTIGNSTYKVSSSTSGIKFENSTTYPISRYGMRVNFGSTMCAGFTYDVSHLLQNFKDSEYIRLEFDYFALNSPSSGNNDYCTINIVVDKDGATTGYSSTSNQFVLYENLNFSGMSTGGTAVTAKAGYSGELPNQTFTMEAFRNGENWSSSTSYQISYGTDTSNWTSGVRERAGSSAANFLDNIRTLPLTSKLYLSFPYRVWGGPQKFNGYVQGIRIYTK